MFNMDGSTNTPGNKINLCGEAALGDQKFRLGRQKLLSIIHPVDSAAFGAISNYAKF